MTAQRDEWLNLLTPFPVVVTADNIMLDYNFEPLESGKWKMGSRPLAPQLSTVCSGTKQGLR